jgi:hypothetical protein
MRTAATAAAAPRAKSLSCAPPAANWGSGSTLTLVQLAADKVNAKAAAAANLSHAAPMVRHAFGSSCAAPIKSASPSSIAHRGLACGASTALDFRIELAGLAGIRPGLEELSSHPRSSRTQRSIVEDARAANAAGAAPPVRRRAHSSGRKSKAEARLYGADPFASSLSPDFLAMFAPAGTIVSSAAEVEGAAGAAE